jgi:acyl-homoserine-lactone acylase
LEGVIAKFKEMDRSLDVKWGDVYRIKYGKKELPGNGSDGSVGIFRVAWSNGPDETGKSYISGGDSWQSIIEFGDKVRARVLMSYGNSTQENSKHNGDQLELFSKKEMRDCYYYREDVLKHVKKRESMSGGVY